MTKTSLKQKLLLFVFSLILCAVILELLLRLAGAFVFYLQEKNNHFSIKNDEYRILCLGESTTALGGEDSYPSQLQQMLNNTDTSKKFKVVNEGIISTTTSYILQHADANLDKYKPQLVIVMMGINDRFYLHQYHHLWWENFKYTVNDLRVVKLFHLIYEHISHRVKELKIPPPTSSINDDISNNPQRLEIFLQKLIAQDLIRIEGHLALADKFQLHHHISEAHGEQQLAQQAAREVAKVMVQLANRFRIKNQLDSAEQLLLKAQQFNPNDTDVYFELGKVYFQKKEYVNAINAFQDSYTFDHNNQKALQGLAQAYYMAGYLEQAFIVYNGYLQLNPDDYWGCLEMARWLKQAHQYQIAENFLNRAMTLASYIDEAYLMFGETLDAEKKYNQEEAFYLKEISLHPKMPQLYEALGQFYRNHDQEILAKKYFQEAALPQVAEYYPITLNNYNFLLNKILGHHIKVIVMQYPVRDIKPLEDYLGPRDNVFYLENRINFVEGLAKNGYNYYFKDSFGNDFGHCTHAGNELIAQNLTNEILNQIKP